MRYACMPIIHITYPYVRNIRLKRFVVARGRRLNILGPKEKTLKRTKNVFLFGIVE